MIAATTFEVDDGLASGLPAGLRPWTAGTPRGVAFSPGEASDAVWRVGLPMDRAQARADLAHAGRALDGVAAVLPEAERRLRTAANPVSFAVPAAPPEAALQAALAGIGEMTRPGAPSFGLGDRLSPAWERARAAFQAALDHLRRLVTGRSWVETSQDDRMIARTLLGRAGTRSTAWADTLTAADAALHTDAVALAQRSAVSLAQTIALAIRGAGLLATAITGPAGFIFALPAAWAFIDDVIAATGKAG